MDDKIKIIEYKVEDFDGISEEKLEEIIEKVKLVNGVLDAKFDIENKSLRYGIGDKTSDYDVFSAICGIFEEENIDFDFGGDEEVKDTAEEAGQTEPEEETEEDKKTEKKKERKFDIIESVVILSISAILILIGFILRKKDNVATWIYMFGYALAGYETLYSIISDFAEKRYFGEKIIILVSSFVLLYFGYRLTGSLIIFAYSLNSFVRTILKDKADKINELDYSDEQKNKWNEDSEGMKKAKKNFLLYDLVTFGIGLLIAFIPPFFKIKQYGVLLTSKWLYIGVLFIVFTRIGNLLYSLKSSRTFAFLKSADNGVNIPDNRLIDGLSVVDCVCMGHTGVITNLNGKITETVTEDKERFIKILVSAESVARGVVAKVVLDAYADVEKINVSGGKYYEGKGVECYIDGNKVVVGNRSFLKKHGVEVKNGDYGYALFVSENGVLLGYVKFDFAVKADARGAVKELREDVGVKVELLSGDDVEVVDDVKEDIEFSSAVANASADYKAKYVAENNAVFVGDASNDKETLDKTELAIVMNGDKECGKIAIPFGEIRKVPFAVKIARRLKKVIRQSLLLAIIGKVVLIGLAVTLKLALNFDGLSLAVLLGVILDNSVLLNSCRNLTETV